MTMSRRVFLGSAAAAAGGALVIGFSYRSRFRFGKSAPAQGKAPENPYDAWVHGTSRTTARTWYLPVGDGTGCLHCPADAAGR